MAFPQNEKLSEGLTFLDFQNLPTLTTAVLSVAVDMYKTRKLVAFVMAGTSGGTITALFAGSATSGGSYTTIASSTFTFTTTNKAIALEIDSEGLNDLALGYAFVKLSVAASGSSAVTYALIGAAGPEQPMTYLNTANLLSWNNVSV
jgi:hypothetical protein